MKVLGAILKTIGGFSLVMTGFRLWREGFPRLEGPEGSTIQNVLIILAPYAIIGLVSWAIYARGDALDKRGTPETGASTPMDFPGLGVLLVALSLTVSIPFIFINRSQANHQAGLLSLLGQPFMEKPKNEPVPIARFCSKCGLAAHPADLYCMRCGEKLGQLSQS